MGDVNGDMVNMTGSLTPRTTASLPLYLRENKEDQTVDVILSRDVSIYGFQMSVNSPDISLKAGSLPVSQSNMAFDKDGYTNLSWGQPEAVMVKAGEILFTIEGLSEGMNIGQVLTTHIEGLYPEIYTEGLKNQRIEFLPYHQAVTGLSFETKVSPNPFTDVTKLQVIIPEGEEFFLSIYDSKGQELFIRRFVSLTQEAEIVIGTDIIKVPGVYYYRVKSILGELSGKFIRL
jgi:hypothetical protein